MPGLTGFGWPFGSSGLAVPASAAFIELGFPAGSLGALPAKGAVSAAADAALILQVTASWYLARCAIF